MNGALMSRRNLDTQKKTLWKTSNRKENTAKRGTFEDQRERPKKTLNLPTNLISGCRIPKL